MQGKICRVQDYPLFPDVKKGFLNLFPGWLKTSEELGFSSKMPNPVLFFPAHFLSKVEQMLLQSFGKKQQLHDVASRVYFSTQKSGSVLRSPSADILPVPSCTAVVQWHQTKPGRTGCSPLIPRVGVQPPSNFSLAPGRTRTWWWLLGETRMAAWDFFSRRRHWLVKVR